MGQKFLILDFETRSKCPLPDTGAYEYAKDESTEILCVAWRVGTRETLAAEKTKSWNTKLEPANKNSRRELEKLFNDSEIRIVAHNALFEQFIVEHVWPRQFKSRLPAPPVSRWTCTAALAAAHALPRNLENACKALGLKAQKNPEGKKLIRAHSIPQKLTKKRTTIWNDDPEGLEKLRKYCAQDIDATVELFLALPPLTKEEREVWKRNQRVNKRGLYIDRKLVTSALKLIAQESGQVNARTKALTSGKLETANQRDAVLKVLTELGLSLPNLQKKTVDDALTTGLAKGAAAKLLKLRQAISKTSTAKYVALDLRSRSDSRLRDFTFYHGSSTGRETGQGAQVNNLPKAAKHIDVVMATEAIRAGDYEWAYALLGDDLMEALSGVTRGTITATPGHELFCADFNAIEARVVFWMAGHTRGIKMFRDGEDLYVDQATVIYSKAPAEIEEGERDLGKRAILGGGFGMGWNKFRETCIAFGREISAELAKKAIASYRERHKPVVLMWSNLERAAIAAVQNPGKSYTVNKTKWFVKGKFLYAELPSGRRLAYFGPSVRQRTTPWGTTQPELHHWGIHPKTKQWVSGGTYGGRLTENVVQATARDIMVFGQANTEAAGYIPLHSIYDELLSERPKNTGGSIEEFERLMSTTPKWAAGLPVKAKGWVGHRYRKG